MASQRGAKRSKLNPTTTTQSQRQNNGSSDSEVDMTVRDDDYKPFVKASVQYFLANCSKPVLIKRLDFINQILKTNKKLYPAVIEDTKSVLSKIFGIQLKFDESHDGFILVNNLANSLDQKPLVTQTNYPKMALLMIITTCLKHAGGELSATDFWRMLSDTLNINGDLPTNLTQNQHKIFGDVQKLIKTEFVKEGYLVFDQMKDLSGSSDTPVVMVRLGHRSKHEFTDENLEKFTKHLNSLDDNVQNDDMNNRDEDEQHSDEN
ncbi:unnamed protein product [Didymodactylos carnosus]|uniref:MAGE domain-containing protein n=1 Tax=Didymodactylos carnosus TaxID=1234261 RepID=A0A813Q2E7_9BILA|nr:unnamed protein product [Didymodactylos carnosus]CAF0864230.1 unnamed protein product [Didymodactylos carnosus]CAF3540868.1 unnamed protein product [Didymodactylos carnosus]CAF3649020.1 unnamed protein product [Didymodactylos carnosus]